MAHLRLQPFNFRNPDDWPRWKRRFEQFREASSLTDDSARKQVNTLLYEEADAVLSSTNVTAEERAVYETVLEKFDAFFQVRRNVIFERARFNQRNQLSGETMEQYIMELYKLAESCNYGDMKDEMIRDQLVVGIHDNALSKRLQLLTLDKAKKTVRQQEAVGEQLKGTVKDESSLDQLRQRKGFRKQWKAKKPSSTNPRVPTKSNCQRCGRGQHTREKCPAKEATCHTCQKKGHYSAQCFFKNVSELESGNDMDAAYLDTVSNSQNAVWLTQVQVNQKTTSFKMDTGAEVTAISMDTYRHLKKPQLTTASKALYGPSRIKLKVKGMFVASISRGDVVTKQPIFVVDGLKTNLLGLPAISALNLVVRLDATVEGPNNTQAMVIQKYPSVFQGLGNLGEEYEIKLKDGAKPYSLMAPRHIALPLRPKVKEELSISGRHIQSGQTDTMVCRDSRGAKEGRSNPNLCRPQATKRACTQGSTSTAESG